MVMASRLAALRAWLVLGGVAGASLVAVPAQAAPLSLTLEAPKRQSGTSTVVVAPARDCASSAARRARRSRTSYSPGVAFHQLGHEFLACIDIPFDVR